MKKICKAASLASLCVSLAGNVCAQQPLPLSLERMFELAETQNRALAVMDMAVREAEEGVRVAKSSRLPDMDASLALSYLGNANVFAREWKDFQVAHLPHFGNNFAFECNSTIQLWITPKRDMSVFFCYVYLIVNSTINLSGIMSVYLAFWQTWEYMHYAIVLALLLVMLTTLIIYNDKRVMPPLPLYGIDWLGMLMWGVVGLCVVFVCTYGEHYDWFDSFHIRFATFIGVITFILNRWRASFIHHSYIFYDLFSRYPMVLMLIGIIVLGDTLLAPEHIFEHAQMEGILGYDSLNVISLNWVGFLGTLLGCLVVYVLFARWKWPYQRMLMIAFLCYIFYLAYFYVVIDYNLPKEALCLPIIVRTVGYVVMATAVLTANTSLPFPFHFCQAVCVQNLFSAALAGCIGSAIVGRMLRVVQKMNFTELSAGIDHLSPLPRQGWEAAYGMTQAQALLESMKEIYGILLLIAIGAWLFAALFHPAIRPTRYLHPLFTTIRSNLSKDMLKKMRAEKRTEME